MIDDRFRMPFSIDWVIEEHSYCCNPSIHPASKSLSNELTAALLIGNACGLLARLGVGARRKELSVSRRFNKHLTDVPDNSSIIHAAQF